MVVLLGILQIILQALAIGFAFNASSEIKYHKFIYFMIVGLSLMLFRRVTAMLAYFEVEVIQHVTLIDKFFLPLSVSLMLTLSLYFLSNYEK